MANSAKKPQKSQQTGIVIDLSNILTEPDLMGNRTHLQDAHKTIGNLFFTHGSIPVHDKGKQLFYDGKTTVNINELAEMANLVLRRPVAGKHYQDAINKYFTDKIENEKNKDQNGK